MVAPGPTDGSLASASGGGNGDTYNGKLYVDRMETGSCADGTNISGAIENPRANEFWLLREQCRAVVPAKRVAPTVLDANRISYNSRVFVALSETEGAWRWTFACEGRDVPGSFEQIPATYDAGYSFEIHASENSSQVHQAVASGVVRYFDTAGGQLASASFDGSKFGVPAAFPSGVFSIGNAVELPPRDVFREGAVPPGEYLKPLSFRAFLEVSSGVVRLDAAYFLGGALQGQKYQRQTGGYYSVRSVMILGENALFGAQWVPRCALIRRN